MAVQGRNFRSYYYDKVGFRVVEEKKSLEKLLNEKPIDKTKLSKFCLMFTLPSIYREYVWKILLDVLSVNTASHEAVMRHREAQFKDLREALLTTRKISEDTPEPEAYVLMYFASQGKPSFALEDELAEPHSQNLIAIASAFVGIGTTDVNRYWLFRNFMHFQTKFLSYLKTMGEQVESIIRKEDKELYNHLLSIQAFKILPIETWFHRYFADVLHVQALERVWDRIIGGSCKILPFVGAAILITLHRDLLQLKNAEDVVSFLDKVSEDMSDIAVSKALDLCHITS